MKIFAIIFFMIFLMLLIQLKVEILLEQTNFDGRIRIKVGLIKIDKNIAIIARKKKYIIRKKKRYSYQEMLNKFIKCIHIKKIDVTVMMGLFFMPATLLSIPLISAILDTLKYQKIQEYSYIVLPNYEEKVTFHVKIDFSFQINIFDAIRLYLLSQN